MIPNALADGGFARLAVLLAAGLAAWMPRMSAAEPVTSIPLVVPGSAGPGFTLMGPERTGVAFTNRISIRTVATNRIFEIGSGVALGDVDGDGRCDIYLCRLDGPNALYRNLGGWRFEEIAEAAGVALPEQASTGAVLADVDGDGDLDLLVNALGGGTRLFLNYGQGRFTEKTGTRLVRRFGSTSLALADIDGDGDLDLYVTNYRTDTYRDRPPGLQVEARTVGDRIVVTPENRFLPMMAHGGQVEVIELGERDFLYINDGAGNFAPVSWTAGSFLDEDGQPLAGPPLDWGLAVLFRDLNQDGTPDLYVCNDFFQSPDRIWINEDGRRFRAADRLAFRNMSLSSMAVDVGDIDRNGFDDILVVDMLGRRHRDRQRQRPEMMQGRYTPPLDRPEFRPEVPRNTLFLNRGDGTYAEIAQLAGLDATDWSWNVAFLDVDLDGYEDVLVATGNLHDVQDADAIRAISRIRDRESPEARLARFPPLHTPNLAFRNRGDLTFEDVSERWGFDLRGVSQGMALADLDGDGDLDVVLNNLNQGVSLYRNDAPGARVAVRLHGVPPNTRAIGARIAVLDGPVPRQEQEVVAGGRYASGDDTLRVFAAREDRPVRIEVTWRNGRRSVLGPLAPNRLHQIHEAHAPSAPRPAPARPGPTLFEDVTIRLDGHAHADPDFDDLARQPLLSQVWSRPGPGIAWIEDPPGASPHLAVGSGARGFLTLFRNLGNGTFARTNLAFTLRDQVGLAAWTVSPTRTVLLAAESNYEDSAPRPSSVRAVAPFPGSEPLPEFPALDAAAGPIALADIHGEGRLDLFVGGRVAAGRYPEPVASRIFTHGATGFRHDLRHDAVLDRIGLVSGAVFADLDGTGRPDLILATRWGPIRVLRNKAGTLTDITAELGLDRYPGWWNGVVAGDFDGDGRLDLAASNWGRNTRYRQGLAGGVRIHYRDLDGDGRLAAIESFVDPDTGLRVPYADFDTLARALPYLPAVFPTIRAFSEAGLDAVLDPSGEVWPHLEARHLDSTVFLRRAGGFVAVPLPVEAQFAPAFGIAVADFDGDGNEDLFLAQNFFGVTGERSRYDAGLGMVLLGQGDGTFTAQPPTASGIRIPGEQRGAAVADFDGDGRPDLAIGQNRGPTRLFRNTQGRPGLRVRLIGPPGNPAGIGAILRLEFADRLGPARTISAGGGYGSQDTLSPILAMPAVPVALRVQWPGGLTSRTPIPPGSREVTVPIPTAAPSAR
ncbi:MAG: VCBS repeat-containing protein [Verrucomicrobiae bacterium]|nr:VCBS repeat-containing protein [Verrucomicrobiae bacterium]